MNIEEQHALQEQIKADIFMTRLIGILCFIILAIVMWIIRM